ncbi:hypothetical protein [Effusibacillus consociatus]|uniref:Spore coat protein n=1 Tax=Effusibacillus consociatus TaxID=1117041 RepID=A0ABV9Q4I3_9BACL
MYGVSEQEMISMALKTAVQYEQAIALKYEELAKTITDPAIQKHLQALEQTARNHLNLLTQKSQGLGIQ